MSTDEDFTRPWGDRLRTWREEVKGWSREEFIEHVTAAAWQTKETRGKDLSPRLVSRWESGEVKRPQGVYRRILTFMHAPLPSAPARSAPILSSPQPPEVRNDEGVDRRKFLQASSSAAALTVADPGMDNAWERLERALAGKNRPDEETIGHLETHTQALFDLEERQPSNQVVGEAIKHLNNISGLIGTTTDEPLSNRLTVQAGTAAALSGWLAFDQGAFDVAERYYAAAERAAQQAKDTPLLACVRTYRSYLADARGKPRDSAKWLEEALSVIPRGQQPTMQMWISARQAEVAIALGDNGTALHALERAFLVQDFAGPEETPPPWTKFFTPIRLDGMAVAGYARINHQDMEPVANRLLRGIGTGETKVEQVALADLAYSYLERGDVERGAELASNALAAISRSSTRVGYERLDVVARALAPYRSSRAAADLQQQLAALRQQ